MKWGVKTPPGGGLEVRQAGCWKIAAGAKRRRNWVRGHGGWEGEGTGQAPQGLETSRERWWLFQLSETRSVDSELAGWGSGWELRVAGGGGRRCWGGTEGQGIGCHEQHAWCHCPLCFSRAGLVFHFVVYGVLILAQNVFGENPRVLKRAYRFGFPGHGGVLLKGLPEECSIFIKDLKVPAWGWGKGSFLAKFVGSLDSWGPYWPPGPSLHHPFLMSASENVLYRTRQTRETWRGYWGKLWTVSLNFFLPALHHHLKMKRGRVRRREGECL